MGDAGTANAAATYSRGAIWLHWTIAALILFNLAVGWVHDMFGPATKPVMMTLHKSFGVTIFFLTLVRIGWRLRHAPPDAAWHQGTRGIRPQGPARKPGRQVKGVDL